MKKRIHIANMAKISGGLLYLFLFACSNRMIRHELKPNLWSQNQGPRGGGFFRGLTCGDINGDGKPDLIGGTFNPGGIRIWLAEKNGFLEAPSTFPPMGEVRALACADLNRDGRLDIVSCIWGTLEAIQIWYQEEESGWRRFTLTKTGKYEDITIADINADGYPDIIAANALSESNGGVQVWLGDESGDWLREQGPTRAGIFRKVLVADLNRDGNLDILAAGWGRPAGLGLWRGDGQGGWSAIYPIQATGYYRGIAVADFNSDGDVDIAAAPFQKGIQLWWGDPSGSFIKASSVLKSGSFWDLQAADINQDKYPDLLASAFDQSGLILLLSQADNWLIDTSLPQTGNYYDIGCADFNADGALDIAASSNGEGVKLWLNEFNREQPGGVSPLASAYTLKLAELTRDTKQPAKKDAVFAPVLANQTFKTLNGIPEYMIGPKDLLEITFWEGAEHKVFEVTVDSRGMISIPYMDILVDKLTTKEVADKIITELSSIVKTPRINVRIKEHHSKTLALLGAIRSLSRQPTGPGIYELYGKTSLMDIISRAGGYNEKADLRNIRINREGGQVINADLYKAMSLGDLRENIILDTGDVVYIPEKEEKSKEGSQVYIFGQVKNPGAYSITEGASVLQLVGMAGGYSDFAVLESTNVIRGDLANPQIIPVNLEALLEKGDFSANLTLAANDIVYIPKSFIANVGDYFGKLIPALQFFLYPGLYRDYYTTGGGLRLR
jgi:protein involved in polysaccharide export with SLBB domain